MAQGLLLEIDALKERGYTGRASKYLVFGEDTKLRGIGRMYEDSSATRNFNDGRVPHVRPGRQRLLGNAEDWHSTAAHELMHTLGGAQHDAPHGSGGGHCTDEKDVMCHDDDGRGKVTMKQVCRDFSIEGLFDCRSNDYFNTAPRAASYLATHRTRPSRPSSTNWSSFGSCR